MLRLMLTDRMWENLCFHLKNFRIYHTVHLRRRLEAILWKLKTGAPWRDLPTEFGPWSSSYNLFNRWAKAEIWEHLFQFFPKDVDWEWAFMDGSVVRAHQHAAGAERDQQVAIGRSSGGLSSKIHMLADSHGNPIAFEVTEGQVHDMACAEVLLKECHGETLINDKGYDSEPFRDSVRKKGLIPMIPRRKNSKRPDLDFDKDLYKERSIMENLFCKLKHFRSVSSRYEKLKRNFVSIVSIGCVMIWLRIL